jgi:outer membrane protein OmpA-like peptidoglycan-associated protein
MKISPGWNGAAEPQDFLQILAIPPQMRVEYATREKGHQSRPATPAFDHIREATQMKLNWTAAGVTAALMALTASAPAAFAQTSDVFMLAQATDEAAVAEAQAILAEAGNLQSLSAEDLKDRIQKARQLSRNKDVPEDIREQLKNFIGAARQELVARQSQEQQQQQQTEQPAEQPAEKKAEEPPPEPQPEQQVQEPAQPPEAAPEVDAAALSEAQAIIAESSNLQSLSEKELKQRIQRARRLSRNEGLPQDVRDSLQSFIASARQELVARESQPQQQQTEQPPPEQPAAEQQAAPPPEPETQQQQQVEQPPPPELQPDQQATQPETAPATATVDEKALAEANKLLSDQRQASELSVEELRQRIQAARKLTRNRGLPADVRDQLKGIIEASRQEIAARETKDQPGSEPPAGQAEIANVQQAAPPPSQAENRAVEKPKVSNAAEEKAQAYLADETPLDRLKDEQIRARLDDYRVLLQEGNLSRRTERRLRRKLQDERQALRARVAGRNFQESRKEARQGDDERADDSYTTGQVKITRLDERPSRREMQFILNDRRPLRDLSDLELQRRIVVYRELAGDERYSEDQLIFIRGEMTKARRELRRRYEDEKVVRRRDLDRRRGDDDLDIDINIDLGGASAPPHVIWAAEEDDEEIERQLVRRPIRRLERRYEREELIDEPEVILTRPEVRESLPGVEIDTIKFGFNEAFVREEEVQSLDRIGGVIERVVTAHPQELFVIEGHTDAVGSDEYNLKLSRQRAEAVRKILLEFYNIGEDNLMTVGLGERYLKIPTPDPEQENRRVTVRRATPLLSEYDPEEE